MQKSQPSDPALKASAEDQVRVEIHQSSRRKPASHAQGAGDHWSGASAFLHVDAMRGYCVGSPISSGSGATPPCSPPFAASGVSDGIGSNGLPNGFSPLAVIARAAGERIL